MIRIALGFVAATMLIAPTQVRAAEDEPARPKLTVKVVSEPATRPAVLVPLYVSLGALQAYDGYSTLHGVSGGARETNPLVGGLAGNPPAFWAVKAGSTAASIYFAERLWRSHHRTEAIAMMVVSNAVMAAIAARNASVLH